MEARVVIHTVHKVTLDVNLGDVHQDEETLKEAAMQVAIGGDGREVNNVVVGTFADAHPGMYRDTVTLNAT